jgi:hypothetical protein
MDINQILADLRAERDRINDAIAALEAIGATATAPPRHVARPSTASSAGVAKQGRGPRKMSAAARKRISVAAKKRWAERRKANKSA